MHLNKSSPSFPSTHLQHFSPFPHFNTSAAAQQSASTTCGALQFLHIVQLSYYFSTREIPYSMPKVLSIREVPGKTCLSFDSQQTSTSKSPSVISTSGRRQECPGKTNKSRFPLTLQRPSHSPGVQRQARDSVSMCCLIQW